MSDLLTGEEEGGLGSGADAVGDGAAVSSGGPVASSGGPIAPSNGAAAYGGGPGASRGGSVSGAGDDTCGDAATPGAGAGARGDTGLGSKAGLDDDTAAPVTRHGDTAPGERNAHRSAAFRAADQPSSRRTSTTATEAAPAATHGTRDRKAAPPRRTAADPVKALLHRHRELCERAVDPLEIAAGLEAHGFTDRTAGRFRHRDVFSLAEEMYARVPHDGDTPPPPTPAPSLRVRADWVVLTLLPGALCAGTVTALHLTHGRTRLIAATVGVLAVILAVRAAVRRGPLAVADRTAAPSTGVWTCWLIGYALLGDGLLAAALTGGPDTLPTGAADRPWPLTAAPVLALAFSCAPAAWTAHLFSARARRKLAASRSLEDFAASARPLLPAVFVLYLCALAGLLTLAAAVLDEPPAYAPTLALGALLFLARLLAAHGFTHAPAVVLTATATVQVAALAAVFAARLPGCDLLAVPVETLVTAWGPPAVPTLTCAVAALTLLLPAMRKLTSASAHAQERPC